MPRIYCRQDEPERVSRASMRPRRKCLGYGELTYPQERQEASFNEAEA